MKIPPISTSSFRSDFNPDPIVQKFNQLWNEWYKNPTRKTAEKLLRFIEKHHDEFQKIAKDREKLLPHPSISFKESFESAVQTLSAWIDHGCDPEQTAAPSEFITHMAEWFN